MADASPDWPVLELSGPALSAAMEALVSGSEADGGIERYVQALKLKAGLFDQALGGGRAARLELDAFKGLCAFISPVRRRIGPRLQDGGFPVLREAVVELTDGMVDSTTADDRLTAFCNRFPRDKAHRWVRDLAAEVLHYVKPELYPLMCRWVWDADTNTGVLREIWYGDNIDQRVIDVADDYAAFLTLRQELSRFLTDNGVFQDVLYYVDLLCAQVYAGYIAAQGGSFLRTDFSAPEDPMQYTRRLLGLDGVDVETGRTRLKTVDGEAFVLDDVKLLN